eukprot:19647-Prorocentrum_minimum.AAC.1
MHIYHGILCRDIPRELKAYLQEKDVKVESLRREWVLLKDLQQFEATFKEALNSKNLALDAKSTVAKDLLSEFKRVTNLSVEGDDVGEYWGESVVVSLESGLDAVTE